MTINAGASYTFNPSNNGSLTVTLDGITANETASFNLPISIGAPQTWTVASGKTLTVGSLHTIISPLTLSGSGNYVIGGSIDGGGAMNVSGGAAAGNITMNGSGTLSLTGAATYAVDLAMSAGTLCLAQPSGVTATYSGKISGSRPVVKSDGGTTILAGVNTYSGTTTISAGALQADSSVGLPSGSFLYLNGGVLQSNASGTTTFTRTLSNTSGSNKFYWGANGGGFAAGGGQLSVRINNGTNTLAWGTSQGSQIVGILKLSSNSATALTDFQNGINLNGATRTIQVDDNPGSTGDFARVSGVISGTASASSLTKTGDGELLLSVTNTYAGITTISGGALQATFGAGIPANSFLKLDGGVYQTNNYLGGTETFSRSLGSSGTTFQWTANGGGFSGGANALNVNIGGGTALTWGTSAGSQIVGTLKLGSTSALSAVTFQNAIDLGGGYRTINVDDNPGSTADVATISAPSSGSGNLTKTGLGTLTLSGPNTFTANIVINGGTFAGTAWHLRSVQLLANHYRQRRRYVEFRRERYVRRLREHRRSDRRCRRRIRHDLERRPPSV